MGKLSGKRIALGVSGGIAAYKAVYLLRLLMEEGAEVRVVMTAHAAEFVGPVTFAVLSKNPVAVGSDPAVDNAAAKGSDLFIVAPATANTIAKCCAGISDDALSDALRGFSGKLLFAPSMNTRMLEHPATQRNLATLRERGIAIIEPAEGLLACGDVGRGKLPEPEEIVARAVGLLTPQDLAGKKVLVTAGPTRESLDPVRFISNHSTGKMGYALAENARDRGAQVVLVSGVTALPKPQGVKRVEVLSAAEMFQAVQQDFPDCDYYVSAAAVADYTPETVAEEKIKKKGGELTLALMRTADILAWCGEHKRPGQKLIGFAMETQDLLQNAAAKRAKKNADMIVANSLRTEGAGFGVDTNVVTLLTAQGVEELPLLSKYDTAARIFDRALAL